MTRSFNSILTMTIMIVAVMCLFSPEEVQAEMSENKTPGAIIKLTALERNWLKQNTIVNLGFGSNAEAMDFIDAEGVRNGILVDIYKQLEQFTGLKINMVFDSWSKVVEKVENDELDGFMVVSSPYAHSLGLITSNPFIHQAPVVYARDTAPFEINALSDLKGKKVVIHNQNKTGRLALKQFQNEIELVLVDDETEVLKKVFDGSADAALGHSYDNYLVAKHFFRGVHPVYIDNNVTSGSMAVKSHLREFVSIFNKGINAMGEGELRRILMKWNVALPKNGVTPALWDKLSKKEKAWIKSSPVIRVANEMDWPPFDYNESGKAKGLGIDHIKLVAQKVGLRIEFVHGHTWNKLLELFQNRHIDVIPAMYRNVEREIYTLFTQPYFRGKLAVMTNRDGLSIDSLSDLVSMRVGIQKAHGAIPIIKARIPGIELQEISTNEELAIQLGTGKLDAIIGNPLLFEHLAREHQITTIQLSDYIRMTREQQQATSLHIGVRRDLPILYAILDKAAAAISKKELAAIEDRWNHFSRITIKKAEAPDINLNEDEINWLLQNPTVRVLLDPGWAPVEFRDDEGHFQGISMGYLKRLEEILDIRLVPVDVSTWEEGVLQLRGKQLDMATSMAKTAAREAFALFSEPYVSMPVNIFAGNGISYIGNLDNLAGKRVAVIEGYAVTEWLNSDYPKIEQVMVASTVDALKMVSTGEVDAFVGNGVTTGYYLGKLRLGNVRIAGETPYVYDQTMVVRDDWPLFAGILQKALNAIEQPERDAIFNRWMSIKYELDFDYTLLWQVLAVASFILLLFLYWNRRLAAEVDQRKLAESNARHARDIAEIAKKQADDASQAKSIFLANMSHELRTPLNCILGFSKLLDTDPTISQDQQRQLRIINRNGEYLLSLINDILDLSRIEAGKIDLVDSPFELKQILNDVTNLFSEVAHTKEINFDVDIAQVVQLLVRGDKDKLQQIIVNLLGNAFKFTEKGSVSLRVTSDSTRAEDINLLIDIEDTGAGIPEDMLDSIFEPFRQTGDLQENTDGVGLGLSITKFLVDRMGGKIWVKNRQHGGAYFNVTLPFKITTQEAIRKKTSKRDIVRLEPDQPDWQILIVDDNPESRLLLSSLLLRVGFNVQEAENGEQAVTAFEACSPDFIWMDIGMPIMDGYEATRKIRSLTGGRDIPIVALTGHAFKDQEKECMIAGCNAVLHKPYQLEDIFNYLSRLLGARFIFQESSVTNNKTITISSTDIKAIPNDIKMQMIQSIEDCHNDAFLNLIDQLPDAQFELSNSLYQLGDSCQWKELEELFNQQDKIVNQ